MSAKILNKGFSRPGGVNFLNKAFVTFFGSGLFPFAPGTFASFISYIVVFFGFWKLSFILQLSLGFTVTWLYLTFVGIIVSVYFFSVYQVGIYLERTGKKDPREIVIDEVVGVMAIIGLHFIILEVISRFTSWPHYKNFMSLHFHALSFFIFRLLDIYKPGPIGEADKHNTGPGVVNDDLLAGIFTAIIVNLLYIAYYFIF